jgi:DNA polymerase-3 subunit delta'
MTFEKILGQDRALRMLRSALLQQRLAHAYLFVGPAGIGKRLTAFTLAKAMHCLFPPRPGDCCDRCPPCLKINSGNHGDVISIEANGEAIKIDQIRDLQKRLSFRPLEGGRRVCIIDPADQMNEAATNALLKTLEEPPVDTHFFLITAQPHRLRPTLLSRCQWVRFQSLSIESLIRILRITQNVKETHARFCAALSGGSAGRAVALADRMDFEKRLKWLNLWTELRDQTTLDILDRCEAIAKDDEEVEKGVELWELWIRDLLVAKIQGKDGDPSLVNCDLAPQIHREAARYSFEQLEALFELLQILQKALALNANRQLALEAILLRANRIQCRSGPADLRLKGPSQGMNG